MKKLLTIFSTALLLLTVSGCTINKPAAPERNITVSGTGTVTVSPDLVSLTFLVRTSEWNVGLAAEKNAVNTTNVINALKNAGIADSDISTYDYRITQDNSNAYAGKYTVINSVNVLIRDITQTGKVIDAAVNYNTGANGLVDFEYLVSDNTSALRQARTLAIQNAQDAANLLAGASGSKVNEVMTIYENYSTSASARNALKASFMSDAVSTPIEAGTVSVTSSVTITYSLE